MLTILHKYGGSMGRTPQGLERRRARDRDRKRKQRMDADFRKKERERKKKYRDTHSEKEKDRQRKYYELNKEERNAKRKQWSKENRERQLEYQREYYRRNIAKERTKIYENRKNRNPHYGLVSAVNAFKRGDITLDELNSRIDSALERSHDLMQGRSRRRTKPIDKD